jgi:cytidylate kinase
MSDPATFDKCRSYIDCRLRAPRPATAPDPATRPPAVTISRQTGAGGLVIAEALARRLRQSQPETECPWTVFDKNIVDRVLADHKLPERLAQFMPEDRVSAISDAVEELLGVHPPSWQLVHQTTATILRLAELGHVILVGRGANVITARLPHVLHVRLVGSLEQRCARVQISHRMDRGAALGFIEKEDAGRAHYLRKHFRQDVDNPLLYHLILNTDWISTDTAVDLIVRIMADRHRQPVGA